MSEQELELYGITTCRRPQKALRSTAKAPGTPRRRLLRPEKQEWKTIAKLGLASPALSRTDQGSIPDWIRLDWKPYNLSLSFFRRGEARLSDLKRKAR